MKKNSSPRRKLRTLMTTMGPFVVGFLALSLVAMAQTTLTNSRSLLTGRAIARANDLKSSFSYGPKFPKEGQIVQFIDASTGSPTSWLWDFGDGSTSTQQNPSHKYSTSGFRKVSLTATNRTDSKKSTRTITIISEVPEETTASFVYSPTTPGQGQTVQFADTTSGNSISWRWDFGDGSTSNAKNPSHVFLKASSYTVTLVSSTSSSSKQGSKTITVASMSILSSSFNYAPTFPSVGQMVQFTDTSAGSPTSWSWDFGDGTSAVAKNPSHAFAAAGFYYVTLTVAGRGETQSMSRPVTVTSAAVLDASFTYNPTSPVDGQAILFTDTSTGNPTSWLWDFGDGTSSTSQSPTYTYASVGSYNVVLSVTNSSNSDKMSQTIIVSPDSMLAADFAYNPSSPDLGQAIAFSDISTGKPTSWQWDFGDGATSIAQNPSHTYTTAGAQSVTLTVKAGLNSSSISKTISVAYADVITAASPSFADVSAAVLEAKAGGTVIVPAGRATWSEPLVITKGVQLIGAGIGQTVITSNYTAPDMAAYFTIHNFLVSYVPSSPSANEPFRLSGFTFDVNNRCLGLYLCNSTITPINQVRIDHTEWVNVQNSPKRLAFHIYGTVYGVADNNVWTSGTMRFDGLDAATWNNLAFDFGTADNFYLEDNIITCNTGDYFYAEMGGRYCVRYNTIDASIDANGYWPLFDLHGDAPFAHHSVIGAEIYGNIINGGNYHIQLAADRGGKSLVFNNDIVTNGSVLLKLREEYHDSQTPPATGLIAGQPQHVSDTYFWGNKKNSLTILGSSDFPYIGEQIDYGGNEGIVPRENVHFWKHITSFDGSVGIGVGLFINRPAKCTTGVGYWATDQNVLYRATAANTWAVFYRPYAYPHPLRK